MFGQILAFQKQQILPIFTEEGSANISDWR